MAKKKKLSERAKVIIRQRAATTRRQNRQEDLRDYLDGTAYIRNLNKIHDRVKEKWSTMDSDQIAASRLQADINFKLLCKVMPDLKMVEIQGEMKHLHQHMSRGEVDGLLLAAGIEPDEAFKQLKIVNG